MAERLFDDWLTAYAQYVDNSEPPILFKRWVGVSTVAACLQRKCFLEWEKEIYPNLFVVLVGPSGCGKGTAMGPALEFLQDLGLKLAAESITREALIRELKESQSATIDPETEMLKESCSLTVFSMELAVFLGYENKQFMSDLTDLYDCRNRWTYRTKNKGTDELFNVWLNLIGGITPELLQTSLPKESVGWGLTGRIIFVYGDRLSKLVPYPVKTEEEIVLGQRLLSDLEAINTLQGRFALTKEVIDWYVDWYLESASRPAIEDHNFKAYLRRRSTHLRKVAMIMSASRGPSMIIELGDIKKALELLEETEALMPNVFSGLGRSDYSELFPRILSYLALNKKVRYSKLLKEFYRDVTMSEMDDILATLQGIKSVRVKREKEGEGTARFVEYIGESET